MCTRSQTIGVLAAGIVVAAAAAVAFVVLRNPDSGGPVPEASELPRSAELDRFEIRERYTRRHRTRYTLTSALLGSGNSEPAEILKIDVLGNVGSPAAAVLAEDGRMGIEALYAGALSPYPGDISRKIVPNEKYRPGFFQETVGSREYTYFILFANDRLGYGATSNETAFYRSLLGWFYCEETRRFYKIRYFGPLDVPAARLRSVFLSLECP